ncbi:MAG: transposase, partial [Gammaproteobacteria bacterium]
KPEAKADPLVRFETAPGRQMQVDWGVVHQRDGYGEGLHRFHPGLNDLAHHYTFLPKLFSPKGGHFYVAVDSVSDHVLALFQLLGWQLQPGTGISPLGG